jgi:hypothetical protein
MEYADGGLYQQSALSGALNKPGFPHRGLTCLAITSCLPGQSVVSVLLIKQLKRLLLVHNTPLFGQERPHIRAFLLANATEAMFRRAISWLAQLDTASCLCLADCNTALAPWISKVLK